MKLCFVNTNKTFGGGEKWHAEMSAYMADRGHEVFFIARPGSDWNHKIAGKKITQIPFRISNRSFLNPFKIYRLRRILSAHRFDALIINQPSDLKALGIASRKTPLSQFIYRRGTALPVKDHWLNRYLFRHVVSGVITNSRETARCILENNPQLLDGVRLGVISNGIDPEKYGPGANRHLLPRKGENRVILGTAGRLVPQKGHGLLLEVARTLKQQGTPFHLYIAGTGPLQEKLSGSLQKYGLTEDVTLLGFVKDIPSFMNEIDIFVFPSRWEGFGYAILEAMAAGKPVVAFNTSSNPELIRDGINGFLAPPFQTGPFAEKTDLLARNPGLRKKMGDKGKQMAKNAFHIQNSIREFEQFLRQ